MMMDNIGYVLSPNKLSDQPETLSKSSSGIKKKYLTEFSADRLIN